MTRLEARYFVLVVAQLSLKRLLGKLAEKEPIGVRRGDCLKMKLKRTISPQVIEEEDWYWLWENEEEDEAEEENDDVRLVSEVFFAKTLQISISKSHNYN